MPKVSCFLSDPILAAAYLLSLNIRILLRKAFRQGLFRETRCLSVVWTTRNTWVTFPPHMGNTSIPHKRHYTSCVLRNICFCANQTNQIGHLALPGSARLVCPSILTSGLVPCPANMAERTESDWTIAPRVPPARAAVYPDPWAIVTSWLTQSAHNSQRMSEHRPCG